MDTNTVPLCRRAEDEGRGVIVGVEGNICTGASFTLLSVPQVCEELLASIVFNSSGTVAYKNDSHTADVFNGLKDYSLIQNKPPLLTATLNDD